MKWNKTHNHSTSPQESLREKSLQTRKKESRGDSINCMCVRECLDHTNLRGNNKKIARDQKNNWHRQDFYKLPFYTLHTHTQSRDTHQCLYSVELVVYLFFSLLFFFTVNAHTHTQLADRLS